MSESVSRQIILKRRPVGLPREEEFELVEVPIPAPAGGEVLVRNVYMSVDPDMRGRIIEQPRYGAPIPLGAPLDGGCVGRVVSSRHEAFAAGDPVLGSRGWREYYVAPGSELIKIDPTVAPIQAYLGTLGMPGMTATIGLLDIGRAKEGETVFVSAASGAVGSVVCQIAKIKGCRVVGSAGSEEKVAWLRDVAGVDAAFNYKRVDDLKAELGKHCPDGIDINFENVGGDHLEAALHHMRMHGRVVLCGMISQYNDIQPAPGPRNLFLAVVRRLTLQGFIVSDHPDRRSAFLADIGRWISEGRVRWKETIIEGIENAPRAFIGLFKGENLGKMLVKIGPDQ